MLAHLFFGSETLTELVEYQIGTDRRDAAYHHVATSAERFVAIARGRRERDAVAGADR